MRRSDFMSITKYDIKCPKCNSKNRFKVNDELDDKKIMDVINREVFHLLCKNCHQDIYVEYPFKISNDRFLIYYTPTKKDEIEDTYHEYMRVCDTFADLKEKLLIYNDNLNDIIIEFIKTFLLNKMDDELKDTSTELRYDNLKKKMKIKKIKKCILIDKDTYQKYYKMRLF